MSDDPIEIISHEVSDHQLETHVRASHVHETYCAQPDCDFFGKPARQGICFNTEPTLADWGKLDRQDKELREELAEVKALYKGDELIAWLEEMYINAMINWSLGLDETIRLRRNNALLEVQIEKLKGAK